MTEDAAATELVASRVGGVDALIVCHGSPRIGSRILDVAPKLRLIGELEGDAFAARIDVEAAQAHGVRVVDTPNGASYGVAEWALAMTLNATRNAGELFRAMSAGDWRPAPGSCDVERFELTGKRVGLIGLGIIGRRFVQILEPFHCSISAHDPYVPKEVADVLGVLLTSLQHVLADSGLIVSWRRSRRRLAA